MDRQVKVPATSAGRLGTISAICFISQEKTTLLNQDRNLANFQVQSDSSLLRRPAACRLMM